MFGAHHFFLIAGLLEEINMQNKQGYTHLSILLDTKGPDIRTWIRETPLQVKRNQVFNIYIDESKITKDSDMKFAQWATSSPLIALKKPEF